MRTSALISKLLFACGLYLFIPGHTNAQTDNIFLKEVPFNINKNTEATASSDSKTIIIRISEKGIILNPDFVLKTGDEKIHVMVENDTAYLMEVLQILIEKTQAAQVKHKAEQNDWKEIKEYAKTSPDVLPFASLDDNVGNSLESILGILQYLKKNKKMPDRKNGVSEIYDLFQDVIGKSMYTLQYKKGGDWSDFDWGNGLDTASKNKKILPLDFNKDIHFRVIKRDVMKDFLLRYHNYIQDKYKDVSGRIRAAIQKYQPLLVDFEGKIKSSDAGELINEVQLYYPMAKNCNIDKYCCMELNYCRVKTLTCLLRNINCLLFSFFKSNDPAKQWLHDIFWVNSGDYFFNMFSFTEDDFYPEFPLLGVDGESRAQNMIRYNELVTVRNVITRSFLQNRIAPGDGEIRNYNFAAQPMISKKDFESVYPDDYQIRLAGHNIPSNIQVKVKVSTKPFNEKSFFNSTISPLIDGLISVRNLFSSLLNIPVTTIPAGGGPGVPSGEVSHMMHTIGDNSDCCPQNERDSMIPFNSGEVAELYAQIYLYNRNRTIFGGLVPPLMLTERLDAEPRYRSELLDMEKKSAPVEYTYAITVVDSKKNKLCETSKSDTVDVTTFNIGKRRHVVISAGIAYTANNVWQTTVTEQNGVVSGISNNEKRQQYVFGMHFYPFRKGLWLSDKRFFTKPKYGNITQRLSIYTGFQLDKNPLNNVYAGAGVDLVPGFNISSGVHFYNSKKYTIVNNRVEKSSTNYRAAFPFISFNVDPEVLVKILLFIGK